MPKIKRQDIAQIAKLDHELKTLEHQYRTLCAYNVEFGFNVDYLDMPASDGARGRQKSYFIIDVPPGSPEFSTLIGLLKSRVERSMDIAIHALKQLGVEIETDEFVQGINDDLAKVETPAEPETPAEDKQS